MIVNERQYVDWIKAHGVGQNDRVASSPNSYVSYLNAVSDITGIDISPRTLATDQDVANVVSLLTGKRASGSINNYKVAMRHYVAMVQRKHVPNEAPPQVSPGALQASILAPTATEHSLLSSYREILLEHIVIGELMRHLWLRDRRRMEALKPQVDDAGDVVLECGGIVRHVQFKSSHLGSSTASVNVSLSLATKPSGCVVWIWFDPATLALGPFLWFGSTPGALLPDLSRLKIGKHTKGNSQGVKLERPNIRVIPKTLFESLASVPELVSKLFGIESAA
mgnify:CR=1 FL=1